MENKKEMTIPNVSAATDAEQSLSKCTDNSIVNQDTDFKGYEQSFEEMQREILRQLDPSYLKTVSMTTLYDTVFEVQTPLIDGLLQRGTYLFVGSPKISKSYAECTRCIKKLYQTSTVCCQKLKGQNAYG